MQTFLKRRFPPAKFRQLLLDLEDRSRAEALKAFEMVRDRSGLDTRRQRRLDGFSRYLMMEAGFQEVCAFHGGRLLDGGIVPGTDLKVFQPFMRFEHSGQGVILGLAAMPEPSAVPAKNKSRLAGAALNYELSPRFDFDGTGPKVGDIFVVLLFSRDRARAGLLEEIAIGVINSGHDQYLFYESLEKYLSDQGDSAVEPAGDPSGPPVSAGATPAVRLKTTVRPFVPPEAPEAPDESDADNKQK